jgi:hypothetical protein
MEVKQTPTEYVQKMMDQVTKNKMVIVVYCTDIDAYNSLYDLMRNKYKFLDEETGLEGKITKTTALVEVVG